MFLSEEESSASQRSITKVKLKKKKKPVVSRKEFLALNDKVDQILSVVTNLQRPLQEPVEKSLNLEDIKKRSENIERRRILN